MKFRLSFTPKYNIFLFVFLLLLIIGLFFSFRSFILNQKLDPKNIEIVYGPREKYEYLAYLKININGKTIIGPKNMVLQNKDSFSIETIDLLNNGRKQIVVSSLWGPYSSVTYLFDYDGNTLKPLCREPSKQELSSEYNEAFKDYPDNGFCTFFASRGKSIEDVDNDKVKEVVIVSNLINHVCPAVRITTYKWNGNNFVIKSEEESQRPDLKECSPLPSVNPLPTNEKNEILLNEQFSQDPFVIHIRKALNGYLNGTNEGISIPDSVIKPLENDDKNITGLSSFTKDYYKSKFIVLSIADNPFGGKQINILFQDKSDRVFWVWVYKPEGADYDLRGFQENTKFTKANIENFIKNHKRLIEDKKYAL